MIERIWLLPPLAFGRLGPSQEPCPNFRWGTDDVSTQGTGKTTIHPAETLTVATDGTLSAVTPDQVLLKDEAGYRPVCPFFELHGTWVVDGERHSGNITVDLLAALGIPLASVRWRVRVANLKPFHVTLDEGDRIGADLELAGEQTTRQALEGRSPPKAAKPLVPRGTSLPLGGVQVIRPTAEFPELRLRFTPAAGAVYGPTDLPERVAKLAEGLPRYVLPAARLILNPKATWCGAGISGDDPRTNPGGLFAGADSNESLGLVDDVCDGTVSCTIPGVPARKCPDRGRPSGLRA